MSDLSRLDNIMPLTLEERGAFLTLVELAETRGGFVPDQERWVAGWLQCSVRKWRLIRDTLIAKGKLHPSTKAGESGFAFEPTMTHARTDDDSSSSHARKVGETETKPNEIKEASRVREARVRDNNLSQSSTGVIGVGVGVGASDHQTDDWPEGGAQDHAKLLAEAASSPWLDPHKATGLVTSAGRLAGWRNRGASWANDVLPVVVSLAQSHGEQISSWQFFEKAIGRSVASSRQALDVPATTPERRGTGPPSSITSRIQAEHDEARRRVLEGT